MIQQKPVQHSETIIRVFLYVYIIRITLIRSLVERRSAETSPRTHLKSRRNVLIITRAGTAQGWFFRKPHGLKRFLAPGRMY
jgi:hypothetical protein